MTVNDRYLIYPDITGDPQGLCIAAIKRALTPKACIVGPVYLPGQAPEEGGTPGNSKRIIVHIFDSFYARGSGDLIELWEAIGLLSGRTPQRGHFDAMNVNLVVQVHSERVVEEWNQPYKPLTERPTNLDPLRFQKFDFYQAHTLGSSSRIETFLAHLGQIQGMQASTSNAGALMMGNNMEDQIMAAFYCQEMRFFGCNQHNMQIVLRAVSRSQIAKHLVMTLSLVNELNSFSSKRHSSLAGSIVSAPSKCTCSPPRLFLRPYSRGSYMHCSNSYNRYSQPLSTRHGWGGRWSFAEDSEFGASRTES